MNDNPLFSNPTIRDILLGLKQSNDAIILTIKDYDQTITKLHLFQMELMNSVGSLAALHLIEIGLLVWVLTKLYRKN